MNKNWAGILVVTGFLALFAMRLMGQSDDADTASDQAVGWQHLALTHDLQEDAEKAEVARQINQLGRDGWQLVDVEGIHQDGTTTKTVYYFKRQG